MLKFNRAKSKIVIKRNTPFLFVGIIIIALSIAECILILGFLDFDIKYTFTDLLDLTFVFIWTLIFFGLGLYVLSANSKEITIDDSGVLCKSIFIKRFISWSEIKDWGLSYCSQTRWEGITYYLYFSKEVHPIKNGNKKKLRGKTIKTFIIGNDAYTDVVSDIFPFCSERSKTEPFVGNNKYHFVVE